MKKTIIGMSIAGYFLACQASFSDVRFNWKNDPTRNALRNAVGNPIGQYQATVLTYLSPDPVIDYPYDHIIRSSYGNDFLLEAKRNSGAGRFNTAPTTYVGNTYVGMYVYAIVLDLPFASFTSVDNIPVGTYYAVTPLGKNDVTFNTQPLVEFNPLLPETQTQLIGGPLQTTLQTIPEPAGVAMIVLGAAAVAVRRRMKRLSV